jgi:aquaporin Z
MNLTKALIAESIGCGTLTLAVLIGLNGSAPIIVPLMAGLTLLLFVYTIGSVSGAHINPAVTIGLLSIKKIKVQDALQYIVAQVVGALVAVLLVSLLGLSIGMPIVGHSATILYAEILGTAVLVFGISSVVYKKVHEAAAGIVIGGSLLLGISVASSASNGVLNPAVAIGIQSISWMYILGPVIGGILGAQVGKYLFSK